MFFAVYETASGKLVSVGTVLGPLREGLASQQIQGEHDPATVWNPLTLVFDPPPAPVPDPDRIVMQALVDKTLQDWTNADTIVAIKHLIKRQLRNG